MEPGMRIDPVHLRDVPAKFDRLIGIEFCGERVMCDKLCRDGEQCDCHKGKDGVSSHGSLLSSCPWWQRLRRPFSLLRERSSEYFEVPGCLRDRRTRARAGYRPV